MCSRKTKWSNLSSRLTEVCSPPRGARSVPGPSTRATEAESGCTRSALRCAMLRANIYRERPGRCGERPGRGCGGVAAASRRIEVPPETPRGEMFEQSWRSVRMPVQRLGIISGRIIGFELLGSCTEWRPTTRLALLLHGVRRGFGDGVEQVAQGVARLATHRAARGPPSCWRMMRRTCRNPESPNLPGVRSKGRPATEGVLERDSLHAAPPDQPPGRAFEPLPENRHREARVPLGVSSCEGCADSPCQGLAFVYHSGQSWNGCCRESVQSAARRS